MMYRGVIRKKDFEIQKLAKELQSKVDEQTSKGSDSLMSPTNL